MHARLRILACLLLLGLVAACAQHQSVRHLARHPWAVNQPDSLSLKFWRFEYAVAPLADGFGVQGLAVPLTEGLPAWATYVGELWLAAYVCDAQGRVVTEDVRIITPRPLEPGRGIPFEFSLEAPRPGRRQALHHLRLPHDPDRRSATRGRRAAQGLLRQRIRPDPSLKRLP